MDRSKIKEEFSKWLDESEKREKEFRKKQKEFEETKFESSTENGLCQVTMNSKFEIIDCALDDSILGDKETIQKLFTSAVNSAVHTITKEANKLRKEALEDFKAQVNAKFGDGVIMNIDYEDDED